MKSLRIACLTLVATMMFAAQMNAQGLLSNLTQGLLNPGGSNVSSNSLTASEAGMDPSARVVGQFTTTVQLAAKMGGTTGDVSTEILVWATEGGKHDYQIVTSKIDANGGAIDGYSIEEIFSLLSYAAVARGTTLGYTQCGVESSLTKVYQSACAKRYGSGGSTMFMECERDNWSNREYSVVCPTGGNYPVINLVNMNPSADPCSGYRCSPTM